jgi:tetratricopeptide (TPR) repeat protein
VASPAFVFPPAIPEPPDEPTDHDAEPTQMVADGVPMPHLEALEGEAADAARLAHARDLIAACQAELAKKPEASRAGRLHYEMARAYEIGEGDLDNAVQHYGAARTILPDHLPSIRGSRRVLLALGRLHDVLPLYDAEARLIADPHEKAIVIYEKGVLYEDRMSERKEARRAYAAALELDDGNPTILKAFARASALSSEWDDVERAFEREANAVSSDVRHRAALVAARARVADARKADPERAIELYQAALAVDPRAPGAIAALKSLLYGRARWRELIAVLEEEALQAAEPETRALARFRAARLYLDRLGALDEAIVALESAATETPSDPMILAELARAYELGKRWGKLAAVLETVATASPSSADRVVLMHRIAQISEERLSDVDRAIEWYRRALDSDSGYVPALQALGKLYTARAQWTALIAMHLGEASITKDPVRRAAAHARVAQILEDRVGNIDQAIEHHARAVGLVPGYPISFKALVRLYSRGKRFRELSELYEREVDVSRDLDTKITYLFKVGRIQEDALSAPLSALSTYKRILELDPGHVGAIHAVQRAAESGEAWTDLVDALDLEAEKASDPAERAALLHRAAEVAEERVGDAEQASARYKAVLALDPKYAPAISSLGRLYYANGHFEDLLTTYEMELGVTREGSAAAALHFKMGELCEERLAKDEDAIRHYRDAAKVDPRHLTAIRAVARLASARAEWREVVQYIELEFRALEEPNAKARAAFRLGEVYEHRLDDRVKALEAYDRALENAGGFRPALDGRARLLERAKEYRGLVDALDKEALGARDPGLSITARLRAAETFRDYLQDPAGAVSAYEAVLALDPNHLGAVLALEGLYAQLGATEKLEGNLGTQSRIVENGLARVAVLRELARIEEAKMAPVPGDIAEKYLAIVRVAPSETRALDALERHAIANKNWPLLAQVDTKLGVLTEDPSLASSYQTRLAESLELQGSTSALDTYRAALARDADNVAAARGFVRVAAHGGDPALLTEAADYASRVLRDPSGAAGFLVQSARVRLERRTDAAGAAKDLERALELCPDHVESAQRLEKLLATSDVGRLADTFAHAAQRAKDPMRRAALWVNAATLHADRRGDTGAGLGALARALKESPGYVPALMKEAELYARDRRAPEAVERLTQVVAAAPESPVLLQAHVALASLVDKELGDTARAAKSLRAALSIDEQHPRALSMLLDVLSRREEYDDAAGIASRLIAVSPTGGSRAEALTELARLERRRGKKTEAIDAYGQAVAISGLDGPALEEMRGYLGELRRRGDATPWDAFADALQTYLESRNDDPRLAAVYLELGHVLGNDVGNVDRAIQALRVGAARFPSDAALRRELAARLRASGRIAESADELRRLVDLDPLALDVWRDLADSLKLLGRADLGKVATEILVALGGGSELDHAGLEVRPFRVGVQDGIAFDAETVRLLDAGLPEDLPTSRLLAAIAPGLERVYSPDFEAFGVGRGDRQSNRSAHPTRVLADRVARLFGVEAFDLYIHQAHSGGIEVEFADPVAIMVPAHVTGLPESHQVFQFARVFANVARGLHIVDKLAPSAIGEVLIAAARTVDPNFGAGQGQPGYLEGVSKNLYKGIPRRSRRTLEEAAAAYGPSPKPRLDDWLLRVRKTATRAALVACDDTGAAIRILRWAEGDLAGIQGFALERGMAVISDALRFSVSDVATTVRRRLGA